MSDAKLVKENQPEKKNGRIPEPIALAEQSSMFADLAEMPGGFINANGEGLIDSRASLLGNRQAQSIQRQAIAAQIGRGQGNRHLQALVAPSRPRAAALPGNGSAHRTAIGPTYSHSELQRQGKGNEEKKQGEEGEELSWWERAKLWLFKKALGLAGIDEKQIMGLLSKAGKAIMEIVRHPGRFISTLIKAVGQGFRQFWSNIGKHLIAGLMSWLFGVATDMGIEVPKDLSLKSIITLVLQIMGVTTAKIKAKVTEVIGAKNMRVVEKVIEVISRLMEEGPGGLVKMLEEYLTNLKDMILEEIKNWLIAEIVKAAVMKVLSMFNPVSGLIAIIKMIYNVVTFLIENAKKIAALFRAIAGSVVELALGNFQAAANKVEQALAALIPIAIGFLASLLGITGIAEKVKGVIQKFQQKVDKALDWVIKKIAKVAKKMLAKIGLRKEKPSQKAKKKDVIENVKNDLKGRLENNSLQPEVVQMVLSDIYKLYSTQGLKSLEVMEDKGKVGTFSVIASASPRQKVADFSPTLGLEAEDIAPLFAKSGYSKTTLTAYAIIGSRNIKTENLGKWKNEKKEQESNDATHHAEQAFFLDELEDFLDSLDSRDKKKKIQVVLEITSSPCADCSLTLKQLVNKKRRQGYDLEMTVRALSVYGGVKKGNVPKWKDSEFALKNFDKPWFKIEAWDVVKELSDAGVPVPEKVSGESFLKPLTDKIRKCKDTIDRMKKLRLGST